MSNVGRENFYICGACGGIMVTVDVDEGTTPMLTDCRAGGCTGLAQSGWYEPKPVGAGAVKWEWYLPSKKETRGLSTETKLHCSLGGLLLRPREQSEEQWWEDEETP
ncbi:hypothetical protein LCGC14_0722920 [marine sediment metagenome]|uniref:Uncharacterized protein n=1 Tax=marine sediment metagenome TaxID=412755 RepID=A0A0F9TJ46_9ZZZZ